MVHPMACRTTCAPPLFAPAVTPSTIFVCGSARSSPLYLRWREQSQDSKHARETMYACGLGYEGRYPGPVVAIDRAPWGTGKAEEMPDNLFQGRKSVAIHTKGLKNMRFGRSPLNKWDTMRSPQGVRFITLQMISP